MSDVVKDFDATETTISLSAAAKKRIISYLQQAASQEPVRLQLPLLRLSVKKTGCSGLSYVMDYVDNAVDGDIIQCIETNLVLCIDKLSYPYLQGMSIDYLKQGLNYKFVYQNPNQTGECGCGESFTVDQI